MVSNETFDKMRLELSVKSKNGIDFTFAAGLIWLLISFIWCMKYSAYNRSVLTFMAGSLLLPLAFLFSKLFKTTWKNKGNPLQPLGLWINFAQLFYFPILIIVLLKWPEYFVTVYAIITGAHFFPYAWFYKTNVYAIFAGIITAGTFILMLNIPIVKIFLIPLCTGICLILLTIALYFDSRKKYKSQVVLV